MTVLRNHHVTSYVTLYFLTGYNNGVARHAVLNEPLAKAQMWCDFKEAVDSTLTNPGFMLISRVIFKFMEDVISTLSNAHTHSITLLNNNQLGPRTRRPFHNYFSQCEYSNITFLIPADKKWSCKKEQNRNGSKPEIAASDRSLRE